MLEMIEAVAEDDDRRYRVLELLDEDRALRPEVSDGNCDHALLACPAEARMIL
jgi:hypothetical protein